MRKKRKPGKQNFPVKLRCKTTTQFRVADAHKLLRPTHRVCLLNTLHNISKYHKYQQETTKSNGKSTCAGVASRLFTQLKTA